MKLLTFESWERSGAEILYTYRWDGGVERKTLGLGGLAAELDRVPPEALANALAHAGLAFARYFFGLDDFDGVYCEPLWLPHRAIRYFELSFQSSLAEMRYRNGLDVRKPVQVTCSTEAPRYFPATAQEVPLADHALLLDGGGKDTAVAAELLKAIGLPFTWLTVHQPRTASMQGIIDASGNPRSVHLDHRGWDDDVARRARYKDVLAPRLGFLGMVAAVVLGTRYVITANERSASEGNLTVHGVEINHQVGKSLRSERAFSTYADRRLLSGVRFFSALAPLWEIQIARIFAGFPQYFPRFLSCNVGQRRNVWCGECPKCAFVYLLLAAFLEPPVLRSIFGRDLFASERIRYWLLRLTKQRKPFECVGTKPEAKMALWLALERQPRPDGVSEEEWQEVRDLVADVDPVALAAEVLERPDGPHALPPELAPAILDWLGRRLTPAPHPDRPPVPDTP